MVKPLVVFKRKTQSIIFYFLPTPNIYEPQPAA